MLGKPFETGNFQGTPHVAGQWGSDWQESQREWGGGAKGEKIAAVASEQEKAGVQGTTWENLGDPAANGEGWGRSHCIVPNKSAELAAQESSPRKA